MGLMEAEKASNLEEFETKVAPLMTKLEEVQNENTALKQRMETQKAELKNELTNITMKKIDIPFAMACAWTSSWGEEDFGNTITYESLLSEYYGGGAGGKMDIESGAFTCSQPAGYYTVTVAA